MTTNHTPGPWAATPNIDGSIDIVTDARHKHTFIGVVHPSKDASNDALLIAAAPTMLAELELLVTGLRDMVLGGRLTVADIPDDFDWLQSLLDNAREAIAQATGRKRERENEVL